MINTDLSSLQQATGKRIRVALVDTGVESTHPWIGSRLVQSYAVEETADSPPRIHEVEHEDVCGHGTAAASQLLSLAPDVEIISVRVLSRQRTGSSEALVAALGWLTTQNIHLVNLSLSTMRMGLALRICQAVDSLYARGIPCICARGYHQTGLDYPTSFASTIAVTYEKCDTTQLQWRDQSLIEFAASGVDVPVAWLGGGTRQVTGSSYAAPLVTAIAARILQQAPHTTPFELKSALKAYALASADKQLVTPAPRSPLSVQKDI